MRPLTRFHSVLKQTVGSLIAFATALILIIPMALLLFPAQAIPVLIYVTVRNAIPIWLLIGLPCYFLLPYPSKAWHPITAMVIGSGIGLVGWLLYIIFTILINNQFTRVVLMFSPSIILYAGTAIVVGAITGLVSSFTAKRFK